MITEIAEMLKEKFGYEMTEDDGWALVEVMIETLKKMDEEI